MKDIQNTIECYENCPRKDQFISEAKENISLEEVEKLYRFLQGEVPEGFHIQAMPNLTADQAFSVIYYLQEGMHVLPDKYEKCLAEDCDTLFDADNDGCLALFCDGCGCQYPNDYDPEDADGCCGCPIVCGTDGHPEGCEGCHEQDNDNCSCINNPLPTVDI